MPGVVLNRYTVVGFEPLAERFAARINASSAALLARHAPDLLPGLAFINISSRLRLHASAIEHGDDSHSLLSVSGLKQWDAWRC